MWMHRTTLALQRGLFSKTFTDKCPLSENHHFRKALNCILAVISAPFDIVDELHVLDLRSFV